ncbi:hypothetical protein SKAU_G00041740 [Synaphobranchus kaupii]|uniref:Uncharacterized protein n=1 Tax=Synaphobranchus kaupii TaxID=118154 RepID=A0A9Q1G1B2_SYNKA|nr:hypothetical protein SKAU_G00041740 [Synaphobranchus kaupii]
MGELFAARKLSRAVRELWHRKLGRAIREPRHTVVGGGSLGRSRSLAAGGSMAVVCRRNTPGSTETCRRVVLQGEPVCIHVSPLHDGIRGAGWDRTLVLPWSLAWCLQRERCRSNQRGFRTLPIGKTSCQLRGLHCGQALTGPTARRPLTLASYTAQHIILSAALIL